MVQADFKANLKQSDTHVSIAEGPSFTWNFAPVQARDALPSNERFKAIVLAKFSVVKLANCGGLPAGSKRGRGDESDECGRAPTKKTCVGAGHSQAGPSGTPGNSSVPIPADTGLVPIGTSYPHEMEKLLRLDMFGSVCSSGSRAPHVYPLVLFALRWRSLVSTRAISPPTRRRGRSTSCGQPPSLTKTSCSGVCLANGRRCSYDS